MDKRLPDEHPPKRFRTNAFPNSNIHKPYRSPLKAKINQTNQSSSPVKETATTTGSSEGPNGQQNIRAKLADSDLSNSLQDPKLSTNDLNPKTPLTSLPTPAQQPNPLHEKQTDTHFVNPSPATSHSTLLSSQISPQNATQNQTHPTLRLQTLTHETDTLSQAIRLCLNPNSTSELETLIQKWRSIAQSAADTLFETASERVSKMGGVRAWRNREAAAIERRRKWEEEDRKVEIERFVLGSDDDDLDEEEEDEESDSELDVDLTSEGSEGEYGNGGDEAGTDTNKKEGDAKSKERRKLKHMSKAERRSYKSELRDARRVARDERVQLLREKMEEERMMLREGAQGGAISGDRAKKANQIEDDHGGAEKGEVKRRGVGRGRGSEAKKEADFDDIFTMDMLLASLNIDVSVVGWDREGQRWVD